MFQQFTYQKLFRTSRNILLLLLSALIFYKLIYAYHLHELLQRFVQSGHTEASYWFILAALGMIPNWGFEAIKWKKLIESFEPVSYRTAWKAVLSGVTLSVVTPNQVGDFAGRVIHLETLNKVKGSLITMIGHAAQMLITVLFGSLAFGFFGNLYQGSWLLQLGWILAFISVIIYFTLPFIFGKVLQFNIPQRIKGYLEVFVQVPKKLLIQVWVLSLLRYVVFMLQYYFLLRFFGVGLDVKTLMACIVATFCVQSMVPSFLILELGLRGATALMFFGMFSTQHDAILLSAYSLWMVNMLLPSVLGMYFIYRLKS